MTEILKFIGALLALLCALVFAKEYEKYINLRLSLLDGFLNLISHIRGRVDCFLTPMSELLSGFKNSALRELGLLDPQSEDISTAYFKREGELPICEEAKGILSEFFHDFGGDYREGTLRLADGTIARLRELYSKEKAEGERAVKAAKTIAVAAALGIVILLL